MQGKCFVDTNIFGYALLESKNERKKCELAQSLLKEIYDSGMVISTQVINELYCVFKKYHIEDTIIREKLDTIIQSSHCCVIRIETIRRAWDVIAKYHFSYWDSMIIASALEHGCKVLFTEDMQNEQIIDGQLRIVNPFSE